MNMTKKGDKHLRTLFIDGARAVVRVATNNNDDSLHQWVNQLKERRGFNKMNVSGANKNARIIWWMLINDTEYQGSWKLVPSQTSCSVLKNGDRLHLHNRNLTFILASEAIQLLRRLCADYPFGHMLVFLMPDRCKQQPKTRFCTCKTEVVHRCCRWLQRYWPPDRHL